jgi:hypothetical protein
MKSTRGLLSSVATIALALASNGTFAQAVSDFANPDLIRRGEYVATAGDCVACHTAPGGKPFAGGLPLATPLGAIIVTNITPSKTAGIGNYTLAQFTDAMRKGVRADGAHLYPGMPYTAYAKVTDDDLIALYAYLTGRSPPSANGGTADVGGLRDPVHHASQLLHRSRQDQAAGV